MGSGSERKGSEDYYEQLAGLIQEVAPDGLHALDDAFRSAVIRVSALDRSSVAIRATADRFFTEIDGHLAEAIDGQRIDTEQLTQIIDRVPVREPGIGEPAIPHGTVVKEALTSTIALLTTLQEDPRTARLSADVLRGFVRTRGINNGKRVAGTGWVAPPRRYSRPR